MVSYLCRFVLMISFAVALVAAAFFQHPDEAFLLSDESFADWFRYYGDHVGLLLVTGAVALAFFDVPRIMQYFAANIAVGVLGWMALITLGFGLADMLVINGGGYVWSGGLGFVCGIAANWFWRPASSRTAHA